VFDSNNPFEAGVGLVPVPVEVPVVLVPVVFDAFCTTPRSISDPLPKTSPCKVVAVVLVPNMSVSVTVIVQSEFTT
jgi:hypothetical protein